MGKFQSNIVQKILVLVWYTKVNLFLKSFLYPQSLQKLCVINLPIFILITSFNNLVDIFTSDRLDTSLLINLLYFVLRNLTTFIVVKPLEDVVEVLFILEGWGLEATGQELVVVYLSVFIGVDVIDDVLQLRIVHVFVLFV